MRSCCAESVKGMSAFSRLLHILSLGSPVEDVSHWGERPPAKPSEHRSSPRHAASSNEAHIGWWVDEKFHSVAGTFRDLSSSGALILTVEIPPTKYVWISLTKPFQTRWCPMKVVRSRETSVGLIEVGLAFQATCDSTLFDFLVESYHLI